MIVPRAARNPAKAEKPKQLAKYTKAQILAAKKYRNRRDLLGVLLVDDREYELEEVEQAMNEFLKGKVK